MSARSRIVPDPPGDAEFASGLWQAVDDGCTVAEAAERLVGLVLLRTGGDGAALRVRERTGEVVRLATVGAVLDEAGTHVDPAHDPVAHPLADGGVLAVDETRDDAAWPRWSAAAAHRGVRSARFLGLPPLGDRPVVLALYACHPHAFDGRAATLVADTGRQAGLALRQAHRLARLEQAAHSRALLGQASGLLMERYHLGADRAMSYLVRSAERAHLEPHDLARELVAAQDRAVAQTRTPFAGPGREKAAPDEP